MKLKTLIITAMLMVLPAFSLANTTSLDQVRSKPLPGTMTLTFDDGPNPTFTPQILAILKKYHVKATFFVVGMSAKKYPELIKQILAEGHAIGNHSLTHPMLTKLSDQALYKEVVTTQNIVENITGKKPVCLRPPYGMSNSHVREFIRSQSIVPVPMGWNSFDYERPGVDKIISWVLKNSYKGQVMLMHDGFAARQQTVAALPAIIEGIQKRGIGFSAICYS